ncbi:MAG TPA: DNA-processing protein DprA [Lachnospiraceae bacterium]
MEDRVREYTRFEKEYPQKLQTIEKPPASIFVMGKLPSVYQPSVAIVGARSCSPYGKMVAKDFAKSLARAGVQIISGMARGIDGAAHEGALEGGGKTFAVLGCGVDVCYPKEHYSLYRRILNSGGVLSEFPCKMPPLAKNFPRRNRIISGLADLLLVVEAKEKSGSLITVDFALEQGKIVYAVPGRLYDSLSKGCHQLIMQGAGIAYDVDIILEELGIRGGDRPEKRKKKNLGLAKELELVYSCLDFESKNIEVISMETSYGLSKLTGYLLELQLLDLVEEVTKNHYIKK